MGKREERIQKRRKSLVDCLSEHKAFDIRRGMTVKDVANELDESESVIRMDLYALKAEGVERDSKRIPNVFWLSRRREGDNPKNR